MEVISKKTPQVKAEKEATKVVESKILKYAKEENLYRRIFKYSH